MNRASVVTMSLITILLVHFTHPPPLSAAPEWTALYDGPANLSDRAYDMAIDEVGNVYVTGETYTVEDSGTDYVTIKYDASGNELWTAHYDGWNAEGDEANAIAIDGDGNVYVTGTSTGNGTDTDYATIKYDTDGNEHWVARNNGPGSNNDSARDLTVDSEGNVYVTGSMFMGGSYPDYDHDYGTIKYDAHGNELWTAFYSGPGSGRDNATTLAIDGDGNLCVAGQSEGSDGHEDFATIKYDPAGDELWVARYDGLGGVASGARDLALDDDGNVYVTGQADNNAVTIKYDAMGNECWAAVYDDPQNSDDRGGDLVVDANGDVYVIVHTLLRRGSSSIHFHGTIKYGDDGSLQWIRKSGFIHAYSTIGSTRLVLDDTGNIYATGIDFGVGKGEKGPTYGPSIIKYDPYGNKIWAVPFYGPEETGYPYAMAIDGSGRLHVTGETKQTGMERNIMTTKYGENPGCFLTTVLF